jgi:hypothetical protein
LSRKWLQAEVAVMHGVDHQQSGMFSCMASEPFGQLSNRIKKEFGPLELKFRLQKRDAEGVVARWSSA